MGLRNLLRRRRTPAAVIPAPAVMAAPREPEPLMPQQRADLQAAWVELRQAMEESHVTSFHACSRNGRHWSEDPDAMRAMAATFRSIEKDMTDGETKVPGET